MKTNTYIRIFVIICCITLFALFGVRQVQASSITLQSDKSTVYLNQPVSVSVLLDPEGRSLNTIEGSIQFDSNLFSLSRINSGNSVINNWIDTPTANGKTIEFAGFIPKGFAGTHSQNSESAGPAKLFSFTLQPRTSGLGRVAVASSQAFFGPDQKTNVEGGTTNIEVKSVRYITSEQNSTSTATNNQQANITQAGIGANDISPPQPFLPRIIQPSPDCDGALFVAFQATDENSGIDHYEAVITTNKISSTTDASWKKVESPFEASKLKVGEWVTVKAIDQAGNKRLGSVKVSENDVTNPHCQKESGSDRSGKQNRSWWVALIVLVLIASSFLVNETLKSNKDSLSENSS